MGAELEMTLPGARPPRVGRERGASARERGGAFTLIELLVVVALIAGLATFLLGRLGGGPAAALRSAQASVAGLVTVARARAMAAGTRTRILLHHDPASAQAPARYLRYLVVQELAKEGAAWSTVTDLTLPTAIYVVPGNAATLPAGSFPDGSAVAWVRGDGATALRSTVFRANHSVSEAVNDTTAERWVYFEIAAVGTTNAAGDLVLTAGRVRPPGSYAVGESPVELLDPDAVRGLTISVYGVVTPIDDRRSF